MTMTHEENKDTRDDIDKTIVMPSAYKAFFALGKDPDNNVLILSKPEEGVPRSIAQLLAISFLQEPGLALAAIHALKISGHAKQAEAPKNDENIPK